MFKKLAIAGASSALLLATVVPAFAGHHHGGNGGNNDGSSVSVENSAHVRNTSVAVSNTGLNKIGGHEVEDGAKIKTGNADAWSDVRNNVNKTKVDVCGCEDETSVKVENSAHVRNTSVAVSNTGLNKIGGHEVEGGKISTGDAYSDGYVENVVNTTVVGGGSN